jgi:hypothetical protein
VSQKWAANGSIPAALVQIAYRFDALQMKIFHTVSEQWDGWMISAVFE